jgi:hypothetical protein
MKLEFFKQHDIVHYFQGHYSQEEEVQGGACTSVGGNFSED